MARQLGYTVTYDTMMSTRPMTKLQWLQVSQPMF